MHEDNYKGKEFQKVLSEENIDYHRMVLSLEKEKQNV